MGLLEIVRNMMTPRREPAAPTPPRDPRPPINVVVAPLHTDSSRMSWYTGRMPNSDPTIVNQIGKAGTGFRTDYGLLREIPSKDGKVAGLIQQRKADVLTRQWYLRNASTNKQAQFCSAFMQQALAVLDRESAGTGGLYGDMFQMLDAPPYGIYVGKIVWGRRTFGVPTKDAERVRTREWYVPVDILQEDLDRVSFNTAGRLMVRAMLRDGEAAEQGLQRVEGEADWWYPHPLSYFVFNPYSYANNPYGTALLSTVFYTAYLKRMVRIFHANFIERNTSPVATASQPQGNTMTDTERNAVETALRDIQQATGLLLPAGLEFRFHELMSNASAQAINDFQRFCDYEAASALIGQSSTSMSERQGSMSSAEVHERVADSIVSMDCLMLQGAMNQLIRMVMSVNLPNLEQHWPNWAIQIKTAQDLEKRVAQFKSLVEIGMPVTVSQAQRECAIDEPLDGEETLKMPEPPMAGAPNQDKSVKSPARAAQREAKRPSSNEAQPRRR